MSPGELTTGPITVLGNVAKDRVDGGPLRPGGCPAFAAPLLRESGGSIVTRLAQADRPLFEPLLASCRSTVVASSSTAAFEIVNHGDARTMTVACTGDAWAPSDLDGIGLERWVHVAPLLRGDVGPDVLRHLRAEGHRIAFDGQGLVRVRATGPLREEAHLDPRLLGLLDALKLSDEEAAAIASPFDAVAAGSLGVPEVIVTHGSRGATVYTAAGQDDIAPPSVVDVADSTGSGDTFMVAYVGARAAGADPVRAASVATVAVVRMLEARARVES